MANTSQSSTDSTPVGGGPPPSNRQDGSPAVKERLIRQVGPDGLFGRLAVSRATGQRLIAAGKIGPRRVIVGAASVRYSLSEVEAWLENVRPDGQLHDAKTWPAVWEAICRRKGGAR